MASASKKSLYNFLPKCWQACASCFLCAPSISSSSILQTFLKVRPNILFVVASVSSRGGRVMSRGSWVAGRSSSFHLSFSASCGGNVGKLCPAIAMEHYRVSACSGFRAGQSFSRVMQGGVASSQASDSTSGNSLHTKIEI